MPKARRPHVLHPRVQRPVYDFAVALKHELVVGTSTQARNGFVHVLRRKSQCLCVLFVADDSDRQLSHKSLPGKSQNVNPGSTAQMQRRQVLPSEIGAAGGSMATYFEEPEHANWRSAVAEFATIELVPRLAE